MSAEEWRPIPGYEGLYEVSDQGRVRSIPRRWRRSLLVLALHLNKGYPAVSLNKEGNRSITKVHNLVLLAFVGPRPDGMQVRHLDGDPTNNWLENLRYGTQQENQADAVRHGTHAHARKTQCAKGHPYDEFNTFFVSTTPHFRRCLACYQEIRRRRTSCPTCGKCLQRQSINRHQREVHGREAA